MKAVEVENQIALKNILFATDFSPYSNAALPYAMSIARQYGARLYAVHVMPTDADMLFMSPENWTALAEEQQRQGEKEVKDLETKLRGIPYSVLTRKGKVWDVLAQLIEEGKIDLLIVGTHGRTGLRKLLMGSIAEEIFRQAPCPVLSVGPNVLDNPKGLAELHEVLFATDFSEHSLAATPYAISLAERHRSKLSLLHVLEKPELGIVDLEANAAFLVHQLKELIPPEAKLSCHPGYFVEFGSPADQILEFARKRRADLIVLGVRPAEGKPGTSTHLARPMAHKIVARAICPVLTVRG
jgi:nucleotide-binding universal stress UspA family protein